MSCVACGKEPTPGYVHKQSVVNGKPFCVEESVFAKNEDGTRVGEGIAHELLLPIACVSPGSVQILGPTRATTIPDTHEGRKSHPVASGVMDYFPDALVAIAAVSYAGNKQHNLGPLHWDRSKSTDEADALIRHFLQRGTVDSDGLLHSAKMAWRALALLQKEIEQQKCPSTT